MSLLQTFFLIFIAETVHLTYKSISPNKMPWDMGHFRYRRGQPKDIYQYWNSPPPQGLQHLCLRKVLRLSLNLVENSPDGSFSCTSILWRHISSKHWRGSTNNHTKPLPNNWQEKKNPNQCPLAGQHPLHLGRVHQLQLAGHCVHILNTRIPR